MHNKANFILNAALFLALAGLASWLVPPARTQTAALTTTRIVSSPDPVWVYVDGTAFPSGASFVWPVGSKHTLAADPVLDGTVKRGVRYVFRNWSAGTQTLADGNQTAISADPKLPIFTATFDAFYALSVSFYNCEGPPCSPPGTVYVGGAPLTASGVVWVGRGSAVTLQAVPNPGYVFAGWAGGVGGSDQTQQGFLNSITVNDPVTLTPQFQVARPIQFQTEPPEMQLVVDRSPLSTPASLDWGRGSTHTLSVQTPQMDRTGHWWVFDAWSDGGSLTHPYKVADAMAPDVLTARFKPGVRASFLTSPSNLRLKVDGADNGPSYNFTFGIGDKHRVEAPGQQRDSQGRSWVFDSWSDGGAAVHEIIADAAAIDVGMRLIATYRQLGRVTITSSVPGITFTVDGAACAAPCVVERSLGTSITVSAPPSLALGDGTRADFTGWADNAAGSVTVTAGTEARTLAAGYKVLQRLTLASDPADCTIYRMTPASPDGYYPNGSSVSVLLFPKPGFRFARWDGDLSGTYAGGTLVMNAPRQARATFERIPYIAPTGVTNGAGDGPTDGVAPGSVIVISGANLAGAAVTGPESPLVQTLGEVTVRLGDRLLPLFSVAAERIAAQLPADIPEGPAVIAARWGNQPEVRAEFTVVRSAPGLFRTASGDRYLAVAAHADGSLVSADSPARSGELVTVYGTGFGPTTPERPLGFAIPAQPAFPLVDPVALRSGDTPVVVVAAFAAPGRVGVDAVQFRVPEGAGGSGQVPVTLRTGERDSNTVWLPVE